LLRQSGQHRHALHLPRQPDVSLRNVKRLYLIHAVPPVAGWPLDKASPPRLLRSNSIAEPSHLLRRFVPVPCIGTQALVGFTTWPSPFASERQVLPFQTRACFQVHGAIMQDAARAGLQDSALASHGATTIVGFDMVFTLSAGHRQFAYARLPESHLTGSGPAFFRDAHHHRS
jgi:hypothetical protein